MPLMDAAGGACGDSGQLEVGSGGGWTSHSHCYMWRHDGTGEPTTLASRTIQDDAWREQRIPAGAGGQAVTVPRDGEGSPQYPAYAATLACFVCCNPHRMIPQLMNAGGDQVGGGTYRLALRIARHLACSFLCSNIASHMATNMTMKPSQVQKTCGTHAPCRHFLSPGYAHIAQ